MRRSMLVLLASLFLCVPLPAQNNGDDSNDPLGKLADEIGALASLELIDGRLRINDYQWFEHAFPGDDKTREERLYEVLRDDGGKRHAEDKIREGGEKEADLRALKEMFLRMSEEIKLGGHGISRGGYRGDYRMRGRDFDVRMYANADTQRYRLSLLRLSEPQREVVIDDDRQNMFRVRYADPEWMMVMTQDTEGRIRAVWSDNESQHALRMESYQAWADDKSDLLGRLRDELASVGIEWPDAQNPRQASAERPFDDPDTSVLRLRNFQREVNDLVNFAVVGDRLMLDDVHWDEAASSLDTQLIHQRMMGPQDESDPPFMREMRQRSGKRMIESFEKSAPKMKLATFLAMELDCRGHSRSSGVSGVWAQHSSEHTSIMVHSGTRNDRTQILLSEVMQDACEVTVDELPGSWLRVTYSDPENLAMLVQDNDGMIQLAINSGEETLSARWVNYADMARNGGAKLDQLSKVFDQIGIEIPPSE